MSDLALDFSEQSLGTDSYGDLLFSATGDLLLTQSQDAVRQALLLRLQASVDDYFLAPDEGVPWLAMLGSTQGYTDAFDAILRNTVLSTTGVNGLLAWSVDFDQVARVIRITFQVETATGVINFSLPIGESGTV